MVGGQGDMKPHELQYLLLARCKVCFLLSTETPLGVLHNLKSNTWVAVNDKVEN
jgi:hypothetical protein